MARKRPTSTMTSQLTRQADKAAGFLRVLSNGHRLRVLCLLLEGERSVGEINTMIEVSQSVLSQHLAVLRAHKLVKTRREAQTIYYSVQPGPVNDVVKVLHAAFCEQASSDRKSTRSGLKATMRGSLRAICRPSASIAS